MAGSKSKPLKGEKPLTADGTPQVLEAAVGTSNGAVVQLRLTEMLQAMWLPKGHDPALLQTKLDELMLTLSAIAPQDELERMLVTQMIVCHHGAMECFRRAMVPDQTLPGREHNLKHGEKLTATYAKLLDTLNKHRGKGQQKVTVEHVHVAPGGQAIVGNVETGGGTSASQRRRNAAPEEIAHQVSEFDALNQLKKAAVKRAGKKRSDD